MSVVLSTTEQTVNDLVQRDEDFHRPGAASFAGANRVQYEGASFSRHVFQPNVNRQFGNRSQHWIYSSDPSTYASRDGRTDGASLPGYPGAFYTRI